jgi:hypothetical protein
VLLIQPSEAQQGNGRASENRRDSKSTEESTNEHRVEEGTEPVPRHGWNRTESKELTAITSISNSLQRKCTMCIFPVPALHQPSLATRDMTWLGRYNDLISQGPLVILTPIACLVACQRELIGSICLISASETYHA